MGLHPRSAGRRRDQNWIGRAQVRASRSRRTGRPAVDLPHPRPQACHLRPQDPDAGDRRFERGRRLPARPAPQASAIRAPAPGAAGSARGQGRGSRVGGRHPAARCQHGALALDAPGPWHLLCLGQRHRADHDGLQGLLSYDLRHPPGPHNLLGIVKFRFPNKHDVYMHDTPERHLFGGAPRTFSHGCMRVQNPVRLAEVLLAHDKGWGTAQVPSYVRRGGEIRLTTPIPVHVTYFTATADDNDQVNYLTDDLRPRRPHRDRARGPVGPRRVRCQGCAGAAAETATSRKGRDGKGRSGKAGDGEGRDLGAQRRPAAGRPSQEAREVDQSREEGREGSGLDLQPIR